MSTPAFCVPLLTTGGKIRDSLELAMVAKESAMNSKVSDLGRMTVLF